MTNDQNMTGRPRSVPGLYGERITLADLPKPGTRRWVIRRKATVVAAVDGGLLTLEEACTRYSLSHEEFDSWARDYHEFGLQGLRITRLQHYRKKMADDDQPDEFAGNSSGNLSDNSYSKAAE